MESLDFLFPSSFVEQIFDSLLLNYEVAKSPATKGVIATVQALLARSSSTEATFPEGTAERRVMEWMEVLQLRSLSGDLMQQSWERLHFGKFDRSENLVWREIYSLSCLMTCWICVAILHMDNKLLLYESAVSEDVCSKALLDNCYHFADMGIIMGGPLTESFPLIQAFVRKLEQDFELTAAQKSPSLAAVPDTGFNRPEPCFVVNIDASRKIPEAMDLSVERFITEYLHHGKPVLIPGGAKDWPATKKWRDPKYIERVAGKRTVPVEFGSSYIDTNWSQKMITVSRFLREFYPRHSCIAGEKSNKRIGYLAQHCLLEHIEALDNDVPAPEYALCGQSDTLIRFAWLGPCGTVSPLHTDPYENVYAQIVGSKYIRLYAPSERDHLYPFGEFLTNTSSVDSDITTARDMDIKFPLLNKATYSEVIVNAGDLLYIPNGWWHFIKSLQQSISISFWFE